MKNPVLKAAVPALMLAFLATPVLAQTAAASSPGTPPSSTQSTTSHAPKHADFVEKRINELHAKLKITGQQLAPWDAFAKTMRDNAHRTDQAFKDRVHKLSSLSADEAMKSYSQLAQMHADNMQKLSTSFSALYGALSDDQKKIADKLFRNEQAKRHAAMAERKHQ